MTTMEEINTLDELLADLTLRSFDTNAAPVDVEAVVALYGISVDDAPRLEFMDKAGSVHGMEIWVNPKDANEYTALRRHIVAHELGHIVLHKPPYGQTLFFQDSSENIRGREESKDPREDACNEFAALLLVPKAPLMDLIKALSTSKELRSEDNVSLVFKKIAEKFDVPISLAVRRILALAKSIAAT